VQLESIQAPAAASVLPSNWNASSTLLPLVTTSSSRAMRIPTRTPRLLSARTGNQRRVQRVPGEGRVAVVGERAQVRTRRSGGPLRGVVREFAAWASADGGISAHFRPVESHGYLRTSVAPAQTTLPDCA